MLEIREFVIDENDLEAWGCGAISLVDDPAIQRNWIAFNEDNRGLFTAATVDHHKRRVTGPAMIPDKLIYRVDAGTGLPYWCYFSKNTIEKMAHDFIGNGFQRNTNINHDSGLPGNSHVIESWIVDDPANDKCNAFGFSDVKPGTWMITMQVTDEGIWDMITGGELNGFSIEAYVTGRTIPVKYSDEVNVVDINEVKIKNILYSDLSDGEKKKLIYNNLGG